MTFFVEIIPRYSPDNDLESSNTHIDKGNTTCFPLFHKGGIKIYFTDRNVSIIIYNYVTITILLFNYKVNV